MIAANTAEVTTYSALEILVLLLLLYAYKLCDYYTVCVCVCGENYALK